MQATGKLQAPHVAIGQWVNDQPSEGNSYHCSMIHSKIRCGMENYSWSLALFWLHFGFENNEKKIIKET